MIPVTPPVYFFDIFYDLLFKKSSVYENIIGSEIQRKAKLLFSGIKFVLEVYLDGEQTTKSLRKIVKNNLLFSWRKHGLTIINVIEVASVLYETLSLVLGEEHMDEEVALA
jgi:hypothetical protein